MKLQGEGMGGPLPELGDVGPGRQSGIGERRDGGSRMSTTSRWRVRRASPSRSSRQGLALLDKLQGRHQGLAEEDLLRAQAVRQEVQHVDDADAIPRMQRRPPHCSTVIVSAIAVILSPFLVSIHPAPGVRFLRESGLFP
jgi:hypothetical protein